MMVALEPLLLEVLLCRYGRHTGSLSMMMMLLSDPGACGEWVGGSGGSGGGGT